MGCENPPTSKMNYLKTLLNYLGNALSQSLNRGCFSEIIKTSIFRDP